MGTNTSKVKVEKLLKLLAAALACLCFSLLLYAGSVMAQEDPEAASTEVSIYSENLDPLDLPDPGEPMVIAAQLLNTKDTSSEMRALAVVDGRLIDMPAAKSFLNKYDFPEYRFEVNAPVSDLSYHFVWVDKNGGAIFSDRFEIRRECAPDIAKVNPEIGPEIRGQEKLNLLIEKSNALHREASLYNRALEIITDIKTLLEE